MKKMLSALLITALLLSVIAILPFSAAAKTVGDYEYDLLDDNTAEIINYSGTDADITIPSVLDGHKVTAILAFAFCDHTSLKSVKIPSGMTTIGYGAFAGCTALKSISIPASVTSIGRSAFFDTPWYNSKPDGLFYINKILYECKNTSPETVSVKAGTTVINDYAFSDSGSLKSVTLPDSVTTIGDCAFYECTSLKSISIPASVTSIGEAAFDDTPWLDSKPDGLLYINKIAYKMKGASPATVKIKDGTIAVAASAFLSCGSLKSVTIPNTVKTIGSSAFSNCIGLTSVTVPNSVTTLGSSAFGGCSSLKNITLSTAIKIIPEAAFVNCTNLTDFKILSGVTTIGSSAFEDCISLKSVSIPSSVTRINRSAFFNCSSFKAVTIPSTVKTIEKYAFGYNYDFEYDSQYMTDGFVISGYKGSAAETYAKANKITFKTLIAAPKITKFENTAKGTKLTWSKSAGAVKYRVFIKSGSSWKKLADTTATSYVNTKVKAGTKYTYTVRCITKDGTKYTSGYDTAGKSYKFIAAPALPTLKNTKNGIVLTLKKSVGAAKYRIFRKTGSGNWTKLGDTTKLTYTDKTAKNGKTYTYTVRCLSTDGKTYTSAYNTTGKTLKCKR